LSSGIEGSEGNQLDLPREIAGLKLKLEELDAKLGEVGKLAVDLRSEVSKLAAGLEGLQKEVSKLSESFGHVVEDIARSTLPSILLAKMGISIGSLARAFFTVDGRVVELDIYGVGERLSDKSRVEILGEAKARIHGEDVRLFHEKALRLLDSKVLDGNPVLVMYGLYAHPSAIEEASRRGVALITPYIEVMKATKQG